MFTSQVSKIDLLLFELVVSYPWSFLMKSGNLLAYSTDTRDRPRQSQTVSNVQKGEKQVRERAAIDR